MPARKTHEKFVQEVEEYGNGEYEVIGTFIDTRTKIRIKHKVCGHEYDVKPNHFTSNGRRCPNCAKNKKDDLDSFKEKMTKKYGNEFTVLSTDYNTNECKVKIRHNCDKCNNHEWEITAKSILRNGSCPECSNKTKKNTEKFKKEVYDEVGIEYTVESEYITCMDYIWLKHQTCGNIYKVRPNDFQQGARCPYCANGHNSKGTQIIENYLKENNIEYRREEPFETCKKINYLPFDFFIPKLNFLIEFDGEGHFIPGSFGRTYNEYEEQLENDQLKNQWCKDNNITLLRIPYTESTNIEIILENFMNNLTDTLSNYDLYYQIEGNEIIQGIYQNN